MSRPVLAEIHLHPLKSGATIRLDRAEVEARGLAGDRRWMVVDSSGTFVTGRTLPRLTLIRAEPAGGGLRLSAPGADDLDVTLPTDAPRVIARVWGSVVTPLLADDLAHAWVSAVAGADLRLVHMDDACVRPVGPRGGPDDVVSFADAFPLLVVSRAALHALNGRLESPVPMERFRPNLVIDGVGPHAEDTWRRIRVGNVELDVVEECIRCVFTTVDPDLGVVVPGGEPLRTLATYRRRDAGVAFGQNAIPRSTGTIRVGDDVEVVA